MHGKLLLSALALALALVMAMLVQPKAEAASDSITEAALANSRCLTCHRDEPFTTTFHESNHRALACADCHSWVHGRLAEEVAEPIHPEMAALGRDRALRIDQNCRRCHTQSNQELMGSAHGSVPPGAATSVLCADCHGSHNIFRAKDPRAAVNRQQIEATCTGCHDRKIAEAYRYSYHGSAVLLGDKRAATCVDCHGSHNLRPQDDPLSMVNAANLPVTCAKCHVKPQANFARGIEHTTIRDRSQGFPLWLTWKIFLAIIMMDLLMNAVLITLELLRKWRQASALASLASGREGHD